VNPGQLQAFAAAHKVELLGAGAAAAVLLGLRARAKGGTGKAAGPAGTIPAAAVVPATGQGFGSTYDSSAYDVYSALQSELGPLLEAQSQTTGRSGITSVPPIAAGLFAPTGTGNYVRYGDGTIAEVESDGSIYGIAPGENWNYNGKVSYVQMPADYGKTNPYFSKLGNLTKTAQAAAVAPKS
jgi:hypothetical protein